MAKERFLTILVPIKNSDAIPTSYSTVADLKAAIPVNMDNINKIYKLTNGKYYRITKQSNGQYDYANVVDREFPYLGKPLEIFNFTYDATRMGSAPVISAQNVMWFAEKDSDGNDMTLENKWRQDCHVTFNGENFYLKQIPTSSKSNEDARYKYDIDFVAERVVLENVYLYDVVQPFVTETPITESASFSFYGNVGELVKRINSSLIRSGLASVKLKTGVTAGSYLTYEEFNAVGVGSYTGSKSTNDPYPTVQAAQGGGGNDRSGENISTEGTSYPHIRHSNIYEHFGGNYTMYLLNMVFEVSNAKTRHYGDWNSGYDEIYAGDFTVTGYKCVIRKDKYGDTVTSEDSLISFENNTIHEALQQVHDTFNLQYYIEKERNSSGDFTGNTLIVIADCEYDFADWDEENDDYVRDNDGVPTTEHPFDYGTDFSDKYNKSTALLSKEKTNTTDKIITRITGVGSEENIPWYYPNPNADGWIKPVFKNLNTVQDGVDIDYPVSEGDTPAQMTRYEKYLKNRIGNDFHYGIIRDTIVQSQYDTLSFVDEEYILSVNASYVINNVIYSLLLERPDNWSTRYYIYYYKDSNGVYTVNESPTFEENKYYKKEFILQQPTLTFEMSMAKGSGLTKFIVRSGGREVYDSSQTYTNNPTAYQIMFTYRNGCNYVPLTHQLLPTSPLTPMDSVDFNFYFRIFHMPTTRIVDYEGYHYPAKTVHSVNDPNCQDYIDRVNKEWHQYIFHSTGYIGENFYAKDGLMPCISWDDRTSRGGSVSLNGETYMIIEHRVYGCLRSGYSTDGSMAHRVTPLDRIYGKHYKDKKSDIIYKCNTSTQYNWADGTNINAFTQAPNMSAEEWLNTFVNFKFNLYEADSWYLGSKKISLEDYGINNLTENGNAHTPHFFDTIEFQRVKYITPQSRLMPELYIKTDGERRFYNAHNYLPLQSGSASTIDKNIGEQLNEENKVINPIYKEKEGDSDNQHYQFENEYIQVLPHEHIESFDDIKPTIKEQVNYVRVTIDSATQRNWANVYQNYFVYNENDGTVNPATNTFNSNNIYCIQIRIDVVEEFGYDEMDSDEIWENSEDGNLSGEYKHPYFYARLRPLGFNLFDLALQEDMVLSMTTGHCGACNFKIGVDENYKKNPVQIWEHDVYEGDTITASAKRYSEGDLRRYVDTSNLYYDIDGELQPVDAGLNIEEDGWLYTIGGRKVFKTTVYSSEDVINGLVGTLKQDGKTHFEGDVKADGKFIESQQDTSVNYVWVALMKDTDTYGTIMPQARPDYGDGNLSVYIRPKSIADVHTSTSTMAEDEGNADKFVLTNIRLPQIYLRRAERDLSRRLVAYMYENNYQKFNFSIKFSRIFLAQNSDIDDKLNENSVLYVSFNNKKYRQYVKHYSYKMSPDAALPEISVDMNEELSVSRTFFEQQAVNQQAYFVKTTKIIKTANEKVVQTVTERSIGRNSNAIVSNNIINRGSGSSLTEMANQGKTNASSISSMKTNVAINYYTKGDFQVENGTDLKIGNEVFLPTAFAQNGRMMKRRWDETSGEFVIDNEETFAPAFIDNTNHRLVDYGGGGYRLLTEEPSDFTTNYENYYKLENGEYTPCTGEERFRPNTYYEYVDSGVNQVYDVASTPEYENIITAFDQVEMTFHCNNLEMPPAREDPSAAIPDRCESGGHGFWFRSTTTGR